METGFPILSLYTFAPVLGMLAIFCIPAKRGDIIKTVAAAAAAVPLIIGIYLFFVFRDTGAIQYYESALWIDGLNVYYKLGMDGISAPMVVLSGLVGFIAVVASWGIEKQIKGYFALILLLLTGMNGVFCALDFFLFYVFWELMLLPMYFLIGIWGGPNRVYAAIKFFLYTMAGSVLMLIVLLAGWYWSTGKYSEELQKAQARLNVYQQHAGFIADLKQEEAISSLTSADHATKPIADARLRALMKKNQLDLSGIKDVTAYAKKVRAIDAQKVAQNSKALDAANTARDADARDAALTALNADLATLPMERTFDMLSLKARYPLFLAEFTFFGRAIGFATLMFIFLYVAFAIKVPVFPFHTWLPWAHVEAPTAISVILAGILLKMGVYGFFRLAYPLFPTAAIYFAVPIALLGVFNIIYGACCAMAQDDLKKIVAYSSVSHMGYCMLGMAALTGWGMTGSVLQMFNHGTSTSMMFLLVGVIYDRAHHRDVNKFGGLASQLPVYTGIMIVALFASMGLPGLSGFISEILVFLGAFNSSIGSEPAGLLNLSFQSMTIVAALGVVLTAAYLLWMMQRVFFGPLNEKYKGYLDLTGREMFTLVPLTIVVVVLGIYPQPLINLTKNSVDATMNHVLKSNNIPSSETRARVPAPVVADQDGRAAKPEKHVEVKAPAAVPETNVEAAVAVVPEPGAQAAAK
jgi:NADH-quinone oxidoreductase subunit M